MLASYGGKIIKRVFLLGVILSTYFLIIPTLAHGAITITFEGVGNFNPVGTINGVAFGSAWTGIVDADAGGSGSIANEPSPSTVAAFVTGGASQVQTRIAFSQPVTLVTFYYSLNTRTGTPQVFFYDIAGNLLGSKTMDQCGATFCGATCAGDPNGRFCSWPLLSFASPGIKYMEFQPNFPGSLSIDNLTFESEPVQIPTLTDSGILIFIIAAGLSSVFLLKRQRRVVKSK